jgi:hypothetical protein
MRGLLLRSKAVVVQSCLRMLHLRHRYLKQRRAALTLQCALRQHRAKTQLKVLIDHHTTRLSSSLSLYILPVLKPFVGVPPNNKSLTLPLPLPLLSPSDGPVRPS